MRTISSKIYDKEYYLKHCFGFEEFKASKGKRVLLQTKILVDLLNINEGENVLDIGCGRGDLAMEVARRGANVIGVDYSKDAIEIANSALKEQPQDVVKKVKFFQMNAKKLKFNSSSFDKVISIDVFEHLYKEELEIAMKEIKRVLKPGGALIVVTGYNKIYLDYTYRFWAYPLDKILIKFNKLLTSKDYPSLPNKPRNDLHIKQHVNEPTYFYLKDLFRRHEFYGKVRSIIPLKPTLSWKDRFYNIVVSLSPFSSYFPLHLLFAHEYICIVKNKKAL